MMKKCADVLLNHLTFEWFGHRSQFKDPPFRVQFKDPPFRVQFFPTTSGSWKRIVTEIVKNFSLQMEILLLRVENLNLCAPNFSTIKAILSQN